MSDFNVGQTIRTALGVLRRHGFAIFGLWLLFDGSTDVPEWPIFGPSAGEAGGPSQAAFAVFHVAAAAVGGVLFAMTTAAVVRAQLRSGEAPLSLTAPQSWARAPEMLLLWTLLAAPLATLGLLEMDDLMSFLVWAVSHLLDIAAYAMVGLVAALALAERPSAAELWSRLGALTRGVRVKLVAFMVVLIVLQTLAGAAAELIGSLLVMGSGLWDLGVRSPQEVRLLTFAARLPSYLVLNAFAIFLTVWGAVLYFTLRRAAEGLGEHDLDVFA